MTGHDGERENAGPQGSGSGTGFICDPFRDLRQYRPFIAILAKNIAEKKKTGKGGNVLKESAGEWLAQFRIIYY